MIPYLYCVNNKSDHITEIALLLTVTFYNFQGLMTNPEALQAINQVQEGLARLQRVAPDLYSTMGMPNIGVGMNMFAGGLGTTQASTPGTNTTTTAGTYN